MSNKLNRVQTYPRRKSQSSLMASRPNESASEGRVKVRVNCQTSLGPNDLGLSEDNEDCPRVNAIKNNLDRAEQKQCQGSRTSLLALKRLLSKEKETHPSCPKIAVRKPPTLSPRSKKFPSAKSASCVPYKIQIRLEAIFLLIVLGIPGNVVTIFLLWSPSSDFFPDGQFQLNQTGPDEARQDCENCGLNETRNGSTVHCYGQSIDEFWSGVVEVKYWIEGWCLLLVAIFGSLGNILTIIVLKNFDHKSSFNSLLMGLMFMDSILLIFAVIEWSVLEGFGLDAPEWHTYLFPYVIHPLKSMTETACVYMVVAVAAERYHAICHPLKYKPSPSMYTTMVLLIAFLVNICKFFEFKLFHTEKDNVTVLATTTTELNELASYVVFNSYHECIVGEVFPLLALCFLNYKISIKIWNSGKMNHRHLGPSKPDLVTEDEAVSNYSPSRHSSTRKATNGRAAIILETTFSTPSGQRQDLQRSHSTFLAPRQSRNCRVASPTLGGSGLEPSAVSDYPSHGNGNASSAHLTSIPKTKSIKSSEKRFQNRREKSIGILVCIITIFFGCHLFKVGIQIFQICLPGHGLKDYYKECELQGRSHIPAGIFTLGFINRLLLVVNSSVNFLIYCIMAKRFRRALLKLLLSMRNRMFHGACQS